jgi:hypothetical protein
MRESREKPFEALRKAMQSVSEFVAGRATVEPPIPAATATPLPPTVTPLPPTAADIEEYCRDPDSSGCDIEMVEALMAEAEKLKKATIDPASPARWSDAEGEGQE